MFRASSDLDNCLKARSIVSRAPRFARVSFRHLALSAVAWCQNCRLSGGRVAAHARLRLALARYTSNESKARELLSGRQRSKPRTRSPVQDINFTALPWAGAQDPGIQRRALGSLRYEGRWYSALLIRAFTILTTKAP